MVITRKDIINMVKKQGGKISCGQCHQFFKEDELILDEKNNRYLCDGCYEPRDDRDPDPDNEKCEDCGNYKGDCECDRDDKDIDDAENREYENSPRAVRGEARIKREVRTNRDRPTRNLLMDLRNL